MERPRPLSLSLSVCLTSLLSYQGVVVVQVLHLLGVVLGVSRVRPGVPRLGPPDLGDSPRRYVQALDAHVPGHLHHHAPRHQVPAGEHRQVVLVQTVKVDGQGPHFAQHHDEEEGEDEMQEGGQ